MSKATAGKDFLRGRAQIVFHGHIVADESNELRKLALEFHELSASDGLVEVFFLGFEHRVVDDYWIDRGFTIAEPRLLSNSATGRPRYHPFSALQDLLWVTPTCCGLSNGWGEIDTGGVADPVFFRLTSMHS